MKLKQIPLLPTNNIVELPSDYVVLHVYIDGGVLYITVMFDDEETSPTIKTNFFTINYRDSVPTGQFVGATTLHIKEGGVPIYVFDCDPAVEQIVRPEIQAMLKLTKYLK